MTWLLLALLALAVLTVFAFIHANSRKMSDDELRASNARVLREYRRMAVHSPEKIVDYSFRRMK